jgi:hypothetical protein
MEIHISELRSLMTCRMLHRITSTNFMGLEAKSDREPFEIGKLFHSVMERMYSPDYKGDWREYLKTLRKDDEENDNVGYIATVRDILKDYVDHIAIAKRAKLPLNDDEFEWLATEQEFKWRPKGIKNWQFAGRIDGIVKQKSTGDIYLWEHKTSSNIDSFYESMAWDNQCRLYLKVARSASTLPIKGFVYNMVNKSLANEPDKLIRGGYSVAQNAKTSLSKFILTLERDGADLKDYSAYLNFLRDNKEPQYFRRFIFIPSEESINESVTEMKWLADEISKQKLAPTRAWNYWTCKNCPFNPYCYKGVSLDKIAQPRDLSDH